MLRYGRAVGRVDRIAWCFASLLATTAAHAQSTPNLDAEWYFGQGVACADGGRWAEAITAFERARALAPLPAVLFNLAEAHRHVGHARAALAAYREYLDRAGDVASPFRAAAQAQVDALSHTVAVLRVEVDPPEASLEVDGAVTADGARGVELDPGPHALVIRAAEREPEARAVTLAPGEHTTLVVRLARRAESVRVVRETVPPPAPAPETTFRDALQFSVMAHIIPDVDRTGFGWGLRVGARIARNWETTLGVTRLQTNGVTFMAAGAALYFVAHVVGHFAFYMGPQFAALIPDCVQGCVFTSSLQRAETNAAALVSFGARVEFFRWLSLSLEADGGVWRWSDPDPIVYVGAGAQVSLGL